MLRMTRCEQDAAFPAGQGGSDACYRAVVCYAKQGVAYIKSGYDIERVMGNQPLKTHINC